MIVALWACKSIKVKCYDTQPLSPADRKEVHLVRFDLIFDTSINIIINQNHQSKSLSNIAFNLSTKLQPYREKRLLATMWIPVENMEML
jgi:hypothetical protein